MWYIMAVPEKSVEKSKTPIKRLFKSLIYEFHVILQCIFGITIDKRRQTATRLAHTEWKFNMSHSYDGAAGHTSPRRSPIPFKQLSRETPLIVSRGLKTGSFIEVT